MLPDQWQVCLASILSQPWSSDEITLHAAFGMTVSDFYGTTIPNILTHQIRQLWLLNNSIWNGSHVFFLHSFPVNSTVINPAYFLKCGPGSSVGIANELRAGRSGIESRWGRHFPLVHIGPVAHPASCKMGTESFPGVKCGRGVLMNTHPLLMPWSRKSRAIPLPTLWATPGL